MSLTPSTCWLLEAYPKTPSLTPAVPTGSPVLTVPLLPLSQTQGKGLRTDRRAESGERSRLTNATCQDNSIVDPNAPELRTPPGPSLLEVLHMPPCPVVDDTTASCLPVGPSFCGSLQGVWPLPPSIDTPHSCPAMQSPGPGDILSPLQPSRSSSSDGGLSGVWPGPKSHW
uniref:Uncharacterized protein n=1 Tax=Rhinopithecus roxellana TaxID=61622 RepID=A0A2K6PYZ0_RHIRO